jgi:hypothetical protein
MEVDVARLFTVRFAVPELAECKPLELSL